MSRWLNTFFAALLLVLGLVGLISLGALIYAWIGPIGVLMFIVVCFAAAVATTDTL